MIETNELEKSAQYWLDAGGQRLTCDAWAVDDEYYYGSKLVYVSVMGAPMELQQATQALRAQTRPAHITSSDPSRWRTPLNTTALFGSQLFRTTLPGTLMHHITLMPDDRRYAQDSLPQTRARIPMYLFPESDEQLPESLGNHLRRLTQLLCPPQWDEALLATCRRLRLIRRLEAHGINAWKLDPDVELIQNDISREVRRGNLRL